MVPIPGPSAVITALAVSGMSAEHFLFLGFLPRRKGERQGLLRSVSDLPYTIVLFEAPHRLRRMLTDLQEVLGDRPVAAVREATKLYEEVFRGTLSEALEHFAVPRGEFTLVIAGAEASKTPPAPDAAVVAEALRALKAAGSPAKEAVPQVARQHGLTRRQVYRMWLELDAGDVPHQ